ncbi:exosome complex component RRP45 [Episyrphus balteatus]|uniref:exosome complex component RRP45 n=1 Tax=Episyrphus balteatus TaxID=286459 RepID=UPI00248590F2|nr:exosome complex component RRP45 [Episyrphus balteatus]
MKETPLSISEKNFVLQTIKNNQRLDGRKNEEFRPAKINFGTDWGSVHVSLGETRVLAQVSCELGQPKATRPNEGIMYINVELGPMAGVNYEAGRNSDLGVQINRTLEKTFKESRCVDLESLCVTAEDRVWILRLDLNVLNHAGNLIDCCSIAGLCALAHFKRPDVSVMEEEVKIHTAAEKELIPTVLHHYPVCVSYSTFNNGEIPVADPTAIEERTAESSVAFGINSYRELCCLNLGGSTLTSSHLLLQCSQRAAKRAKLIVDQVKKALEDDAKCREENRPVGFTECLRLNKITALAEDRLALKLRHFSFQNIQDDHLMKDENMSDNEEDNKNVISMGENTGILNSNQESINWVPEGANDDSDNEFDSDDEDEDDEMDGVNLEHQVENALHNVNQRLNQPISKKKNIPLLSQKNWQQPDGSDSEEEETIVLE